MSGIFGGGTTTTSQTTNNQTNPSQLASPYLSQLLGNAGLTYNSQQGTPFYQGELYAGLNPQQLSAMSGLNTAAGQTAGASTAQMSAGTSGLGALSQGQSLANQVGALATGNPTQQNISNAQQYANNPYTQGMVNAANTPISQELNENALPANNMAAAATGNTDGSRPAISQAILQRDAGTQEANNSATILGNQYNNGLNLSQSALSSGELTGSMDANALTSNASTANTMLGSGINGLLTSAQVPLTTGTLAQANQQGLDNQAYTQYQGNLSQPYSLMSPLWSMATSPTLGAQSQGQSTGSVTQPGPGVVGGTLGTLTGLGSLISPTGLLGTSGGLFGTGGLLSGMFGTGTSGTQDYSGGGDLF